MKKSKLTKILDAISEAGCSCSRRTETFLRPADVIVYGKLAEYYGKAYDYLDKIADILDSDNMLTAVLKDEDAYAARCK
jgi:hypothetical protein